MEFFDSHTHLNDPAFWGQTDEYLRRANQLDVNEMAIIGSNKQFNDRAMLLAKKYPQLHAVVGWHPEFAQDYGQKQEQELIAQIKDPRAVAIGEIGLDYHWEHDPEPKKQQALFERQLDLAEQYHMPVAVHTRDAFADTYDILKKRHMDRYGLIMHSFNGSVDWFNKFLDLGFYVSYSGVVSFKNAPEVRESAKATPLDRLLIETDAPYLTPVPHRGTQNEPAYVRYVATAIAQCRDLPLTTIAHHTFKNAHEVYQLDDKN